MFRALIFLVGVLLTTTALGHAMLDDVRMVRRGDSGPLVVVTALLSGDGIGTVLSTPTGISMPGGPASHGFPLGSLVSLVATPAQNHAFERWDGACVHSHSVCSFEVEHPTSMTAIFRTEQNLQVQFGGNGTGRVTSSPAKVDCASNCFVRFITGTTVQLTATPDPGSSFVRWDSGNGTSCPSLIASTCTVSMSEARMVRAVFTAVPPPTVRLDVYLAGDGLGRVTSSPAGISCTPRCAARFNPGSEVTLTAIPVDGSSFAGWSRACTSAGMHSTCRITLDQAREAQATFNSNVPAQFSLAVGFAGTGLGTVSSQPVGIDCPGICEASFDSGSTVTMTAKTNASSLFDGWSGACTGNASTCDVVMSQHRTQTATFMLNPAPQRLLTVSVIGEGRITSLSAGIDCPGTCTSAFVDGTPVALIRTPTSGWQFDQWTGACEGSDDCSVPMTAPRSVLAYFEQIDSAAQVFSDGFED